jgi:NAD(P)H-quinone oxidoreductase subunit 2
MNRFPLYRIGGPLRLRTSGAAATVRSTRRSFEADMDLFGALPALTELPHLAVASLATAPAIGLGITAAQLNSGAIAPEAAILIALLICLLVDLAGEEAAIRWVPPICYAGLGTALVLLALQWNAPLEPSFLGSFLADDLAVAFRAVVAASTLLSLMISWRYVERSGSPVGEYAAILLAATLGAMFLCGSTDLVSIFVSLETLSVSSYLLSGYMKRDARSGEAALKYLLVGSAAAAVFLYGASLLYGLTGGSTGLDAVGLALQTSATPVTALALVFVLATVAFKIAAVPFHQWTPDVYEGSPTPVVAFLSVGSKAAGFALALRLLVGCFDTFDTQWKLLFTVLAVLSMTLGNVVALAQTTMKRMLAYSSIGQAGFVMIGLVCGTEDGYAAMVLYMAAYLFMNLGAFACIILFSLRTGSDRISDYAGLYQKDPLITLGLSLCLLSLGGIPPMLGFFGKIYLFFAGWADHQYLLVVVGLITSVVSIYYYISVIKMMVVKEPQEASDVVKAYPAITWNLAGMGTLRTALVACVLITAVGGVLSNPLFSWANEAVTGTPMLQQSIASSTAREATAIAVAPVPPAPALLG